MPINTDKYGLQAVFTINGYDENDQLQLFLRRMKETTFTNGQETVYLMGGTANAKSASFDHSKTAMISGSSAEINEGLVEAQIGSGATVLSNTTEIRFSETLTVTTADTLTLTHTPTGTANEEVKFAYILNTSGQVTSVKEQASAVATDKFTVSAKTVTFNTGEAPVGTIVRFDYFPTTASARKFTNSTERFSSTLRIECDALFKDVCSDQLVRGKIVMPKGHIEGSFTWNTTSGGDVAVHDFTCEALETCTNPRLWDWYVYDEDDLS